MRSLGAEQDLAATLADTRERTLALVEPLSDDVMHRPLDPIMSPLVWDLAHIAAYEDLWAVHRLGGEPLPHEDLAATYDHLQTPAAGRAGLWVVRGLGGEPLLHEDLAATYDAFETPRAVRADIELLDRPGALRYMDDVRERSLAVLDRQGADELHELVIFHELQHSETMRQALYLGGQAGG